MGTCLSQHLPPVIISDVKNPSSFYLSSIDNEMDMKIHDEIKHTKNKDKNE
jgi:hypothetical protein